MNSRGLALTLFLVGAVAVSSASSAEPPAALKAVVARLLPNITEDAITPSPIPNIYQVVYGAEILYITADGRFILKGDLFDRQSRANLTAQTRQQVRRRAVNALGDSSMIVFPAKDSKYTVTVFTDVDCVYCARFHRQMAEYNAHRISVRYAAFPRSGMETATYAKMVSVWCANDPHWAMTRAKAGQSIAPRNCKNPIAEHYQAGQGIGVRGTPSIVLDSGELVGGYVSPKDLATLLNSPG